LSLRLLLAAARQPVDEKVRQARVLHLPLSGRDIVLDAVEPDQPPLRIEQCVGAAGIAIAWLARAARVRDQARAIEGQDVAIRETATLQCPVLSLLEDDLDMGVADKAVGRLLARELDQRLLLGE
jgi:hypothetical protein